MKKLFITLFLFLVLTSCGVNNSENNTNSGTNIEKFSSGEKNISTENNTNSGNSQTGNLETNQTEQMTKKLQNGDVVAFMTTNKGKIEIFLDTKNAPITTANFIGLTKKGYYNGIMFHRIIKDFMIQGGDPAGTGMGGKSIYGEKFVDEFSENLKNNKFTIAMANAGANTNGSQFFINVADNNFLDGKHAVFGEVINGKDNVLAISKVKTGANDKPENEVKIISLEVKEYENGKFVDYDFSEEQAKKDYEKYLTDLEKKQEEAKKAELEAKKDMIIGTGSIVIIDFTLKNEDKTEVTKNTAQVEVVEKAEIMSGLNDSLKGMKIGEKKTLTLTPEIGYGEYKKELIQDVPRENLAELEKNGFKLENGTETPFGKIVEVSDKTVKIDTNNPFAGKNMIIDFEVKDIQG